MSCAGRDDKNLAALDQLIGEIIVNASEDDELSAGLRGRCHAPVGRVRNRRASLGDRDRL
jgi:hypothetical protein